MKTPRSSNRGSTISAQSSASQHSSNPPPSPEQSAPSRRRSARRLSQLVANSNTSSSSYLKQTPVLSILDGSFSSSDPKKSSSTMFRRKAKNLLDSLNDLSSSETGKTSLQDPSSILSKRPTVDSHDLSLKKAKGKSSTKSTNDSDPLSLWLEDCLPPLPPQQSPSLGCKNSPDSLPKLHPSSGEGIIGYLWWLCN